jgi:hypothetical protein
MTEPRKCVVNTAEYWYGAARLAQAEGNMREALLYMENAFNHTENALVALLQAGSWKDQPPMSGREKMTIDQMRAELDSLHHQ